MDKSMGGKSRNENGLSANLDFLVPSVTMSISQEAQRRKAAGDDVVNLSAKSSEFLCDLVSQFASWAQYEALDPELFDIKFVQYSQAKGGCFTGTRLRLGDYVLTIKYFR